MLGAQPDKGSPNGLPFLFSMEEANAIGSNEISSGGGLILVIVV